MAKTKFEIYKDKKGEYRWRLLSQNGEPVATGGEGYAEKRGAMNAVKKLKDSSNTDNIVDTEKAAAAKKAAPKAAAKPATKKVAKKAPAPKKAVKKVAKKAPAPVVEM